MTQRSELDQYIIDKLDKLHNYITLPIGIGLVASFIHICLYGFKDYFENFLEWIIGVTMVVIVVDYLTERGKQE